MSSKLFELKRKFTSLATANWISRGQSIDPSIPGRNRLVARTPGAVAGLLGQVITVLLFVGLLPITANAQGLNWEGQTGGFITPFAYTAPSPSKGFGKPAVAFHFLNGGPVVGNYYNASLTVGLFGRVELGYTRSFNTEGSTIGLSPLFKGGFNIVHGKVNLLPENTAKKNYLPALSVGFVARTNVQHVGGVLAGKGTTNGDLYIVATKTITQTKGLPIVLNVGFKGTNTSVFGFAGNAPAWQGRFFGTGAIVVKGPAKSTLIFGSEIVQQPRSIQGLPGPTIPTTVTYIFRLIPAPETVHLNLDFGVAQAVGAIAPGVDIKARHQFAMGMTYWF